MLKVLGLAGSPRRGGNTETLLDQALAGAQSRGAQITKIVVNDLVIRGCQHCDGCLGTGVCVIEDDIQFLHRQLREVDRLILSSPLFFLGLPSQIKAVIDRCQALWVEKYLLKIRHQFASDGSRRRGLFICVGGMQKPNLFQGSIATVKAFFASCDIEYGDELLIEHVDELNAIGKHPSARADAFRLGVKLVEAQAVTSARVV